jgi:hypothetical protein
VSGRDRYRDVGEALRVSIENAIAHATPSRRDKVLLAVYHQLASWSRLSELVYEPHLAAIARLPGDDAGAELRRELRALAKAGALVYKPGRRRHADPVWIGLPGAGAKQLPLVASVGDLPPMQPPNVVDLPRIGGRSPKYTSYYREAIREESSELTLEQLPAPVRCVVCELDVHEAAYAKGQWWCRAHVELAA